MLLEKVDLLNNQINTLEEISNLYSIQDSIRCKEIDNYKKAYEDSYVKYNKLNTRYKITKIVSISSLLVLLGALLW